MGKSFRYLNVTPSKVSFMTTKVFFLSEVPHADTVTLTPYFRGTSVCLVINKCCAVQPPAKLSSVRTFVGNTFSTGPCKMATPA